MTTTTAPADASDPAPAPAPAPLLPVAGPSQKADAPPRSSPAPQPRAPAIHLRDLRKVYTVHEREAGVLASMRSLVRRRSRDIAAVDGVSFDVQPGEIVGFLGPNGAGKTTTLKMLSGLLYPSAGEVQVLGHDPWRRERAYLRQITLVMGNRNQLVWDIPAANSFELNRAIYRIPVPEFRAHA